MPNGISVFSLLINADQKKQFIPSATFWQRLALTVLKTNTMHVPSNDSLHGKSKKTYRQRVYCPVSVLVPAEKNGEKARSTAAFIEIETSFSLMGECKCVIYTCLVFYHDKAVHTLGKGKREMQAVASFIACPVSFTRLWFSIMLLSAAVKRPASIETNLSYSAFWFHSFSLSSLLLAYSFFTCDCQPVKVILKQSNPL